MTRAIPTVVAVTVLIVATIFVRSTTMTVHTPMPPNSRLAVTAEARWRSNPRSAARLARALTIQCVAETKATARIPSFRWNTDGEFHFVVTPALDKPDRRQLRGCLNDLRMSSLVVTVHHMQWPEKEAA